MKAPNEPLIKILFVKHHKGGEVVTENMWAATLGNDFYRLDNCPLFFDGISVDDEIYAPFDKLQNRPVFKAVARKSGNRTLRLVFDHPAQEGNASQDLLDKLKSLGCGYEGAGRKRIAINIPPTTSFDAVTLFLSHTSVHWEHADPPHEDLYPD